MLILTAENVYFGALVVTLAILLRLINCRFIISTVIYCCCLTVKPTFRFGMMLLLLKIAKLLLLMVFVCHLDIR